MVCVVCVPGFDGVALVEVSVSGHDRIAKGRLRNGAEAGWVVLSDDRPALVARPLAEALEQ